MARIAGVDLPLNKRVEIGLTYIFGIGRSRSKDILTKATVNRDTRVKDLTEDDVRKIRQIITDEGKVEGERQDRKSTRLNSSHVSISYAVFCLKKKKKKMTIMR